MPRWPTFTVVLVCIKHIVLHVAAASHLEAGSVTGDLSHLDVPAGRAAGHLDRKGKKGNFKGSWPLLDDV